MATFAGLPTENLGKHEKELMMLQERWEELRVPPKKAVSFWVQFSRVEFALKATRFARGREGESAFPAWDDFGSEVADAIAPQADEPLARAVEYILAHPPKKQIVEGLRARFEAVASPTGKPTDIEAAMVYMRRVRNNLFHGGKYFEQDVANRDELLIDASMTILESCVRAVGDVWHAYDTGDA
jgi:hypothetical protein